MPCSTRNAIRLSTFQARAQSAEPTMNTTSPESQIRRPPKRSSAQPANGTAAESASR
jgi:hypothetical protein